MLKCGRNSTDSSFYALDVFRLHFDKRDFVLTRFLRKNCLKLGCSVLLDVLRTFDSTRDSFFSLENRLSVSLEFLRQNVFKIKTASKF